MSANGEPSRRIVYHHSLRLTARIVVLAVWSSVFVLALLLVGSHGVSMVANAPGTAATLETARPMRRLLHDGLLLYSVGIGSLATGVLLLSIGWRYFRSALP